MLYLVDVGLFESYKGVITCLKLAERLDKSMTNSPRLRAWLESQKAIASADDVMTSPDDVMTSAELDKIRLDKNKKTCVDDAEKKRREESVTNSFEYWWSVYPKKIDKKKSFLKWKVITKKLNSEQVSELTNKIADDIEHRLSDLQAGSDRFIGFDRLHASTYLNNERWNDEY